MPNDIRVSPIIELNSAPTEPISKAMIKVATQPLTPVSTIPPEEADEIEYTHFEQSDGLCGPASLRILLSHFNKNYSEEDLAKITNANKDYGAEHEGLIKGVKGLGGYVFEKENGTLEELRYFVRQQKLPVLIDWFDRDGDHYSVIANITDKHIIVVDPATKDGGKRQIDIKDFDQIWFGFVGRDNRTVSWNWYMVVTFEPKQFKVLGNYY